MSINHALIDPVGDDVEISFVRDKYIQSDEGGHAFRGSKQRLVDMDMVLHSHPNEADKLNGGRVKDASNIAAHEAGHASQAKLIDIKPRNGTIMDFRYQVDEALKKFSDDDAKKLRDAYNDQKETKEEEEQ